MRREGYPCGRVTLTGGLKLAVVYKQISHAGLPSLLTCLVTRNILCNGGRFEIILMFSLSFFLARIRSPTCLVNTSCKKRRNV